LVFEKGTSPLGQHDVCPVEEGAEELRDSEEAEQGEQENGEGEEREEPLVGEVARERV